MHRCDWPMQPLEPRLAAQAQAPHPCGDHVSWHVLQVITKLLYLLCQGETFSKVS